MQLIIFNKDTDCAAPDKRQQSWRCWVAGRLSGKLAERQFMRPPISMNGRFHELANRAPQPLCSLLRRCPKCFFKANFTMKKPRTACRQAIADGARKYFYARFTHWRGCAQRNSFGSL
jgi:hypothetical protein